MQIFSFPFRLQPNGRVATVEQGSDAGDVEAVAMLLLTRLGERPLVPSFGIPDPTFNTLDEHDVIAAVATFLPGVTVRSVTAAATTDRTQQVQIELGDRNAQS
jgi:phage baseplate assembly protein W